MNLNQSLLTIGAVMILTLITLRVNSNTLQTQEIMHNSKYSLTAISLGISIIESANKLAFDHNTTEDVVTSTSQLTAVSSLGRETGEYHPDDFNDVDDYNNFSIIDTTLFGDIFNVRCKVVYVNTNNLNSYSLSPTFHKKINIWVSSPAMKDTIELSTIFSYWAFR